MGLIVNEPEPFLVCTSCQWCIIPSKVKQHLQDKHSKAKDSKAKRSKAKIKVDLEKLNKICQKLGISEEYPPIKPGMKAFKALPVEPGFQCCHCNFSSINIKKVKQHFTAEHPTAEKLAYPKVSVQRFQILKPPFVVDTSHLLPPPVSSGMASLRKGQIGTREFDLQTCYTRPINVYTMESAHTYRCFKPLGSNFDNATIWNLI